MASVSNGSGLLSCAPVRRLAIVLAVLAAVVATGVPGVSAAPRAELWPRWLAHDAASALAIDHGDWSRFLQTYASMGADGIVRLAYGRVTQADRIALHRYIDRLAASPVSALNRAEQLAFWINLYNALTVDLVLDHYPVGSILNINISPGFFAIGPWGKKLVAVEGEGLSLDDIEHRILRPIWRDPRIHYAVNCAALGCPNLALEAYTAANVERLLEANAAAHVNHPRGVQVENGRLIVSSIYRWFVADFGGGEAGVLRHLRRYAKPPLATRLAGVNHIDDDEYDWTLNDVTTR